MADEIQQERIHVLKFDGDDTEYTVPQKLNDLEGLNEDDIFYTNNFVELMKSLDDHLKRTDNPHETSLIQTTEEHNQFSASDVKDHIDSFYDEENEMYPHDITLEKLGGASIEQLAKLAQNLNDKIYGLFPSESGTDEGPLGDYDLTYTTTCQDEFGQEYNIFASTNGITVNIKIFAYSADTKIKKGEYITLENILPPEWIGEGRPPITFLVPGFRGYIEFGDETPYIEINNDSNTNGHPGTVMHSEYCLTKPWVPEIMDARSTAVIDGIDESPEENESGMLIYPSLGAHIRDIGKQLKDHIETSADDNAHNILNKLEVLEENIYNDMALINSPPVLFIKLEYNNYSASYEIDIPFEDFYAAYQEGQSLILIENQKTLWFLDSINEDIAYFFSYSYVEDKGYHVISYISIDNTNAIWYEETLSNTELSIPTINYIDNLFSEQNVVVQLFPVFVDSIDECTNVSKIYVLPDGSIYAYQFDEWINTGHKFIPADYEDRIIDLEEQNLDFNNKLETATEQRENLNNRINNVEGDILNHQTSLNYLLTKEDSYGNRIDTLETDKEIHAGRIDTVESSVTTYGNDLLQLKENYSTDMKNIAETEDNHSKRISDLETNYSTCNAKILANQSDIAILQKNESDAQSDIKDLQSDIFEIQQNIGKQSEKDTLHDISILSLTNTGILDKFHSSEFALFKQWGVIGDSLSVGCTSIQDGNKDEYMSWRNIYYSWGQYLARRLGNTCLHFGESGITTTGWLSNETNGLRLLQQPDQICQCYILALGANHSNETIETICNNYRTIINGIRSVAPGAPIFMFTLAYPRGDVEFISQLNEAIREFVARKEFNKVYLVDMQQKYDSYFKSGKLKECITSDWHFTPLGYLYISYLVEEAISEVMSEHPTDFRNVYQLTYGDFSSGDTNNNAALLNDGAKITDESTLTTSLQSLFNRMENKKSKLVYFYGYPSDANYGFSGTLSREYENYGTFIAHSSYNNGCTITKTRSNGVWQPLEWENPPLEAGIEYRTTERYQGYPIYIKYLEIPHNNWNGFGIASSHGRIIDAQCKFNKGGEFEQAQFFNDKVLFSQNYAGGMGGMIETDEQTQLINKGFNSLYLTIKYTKFQN